MSDHASQLTDSLRRGLSHGTFDPWRVLHDAGVTGMRVPEELGGLGLPITEAAAVFDMLGELRIAAPFLETSILSAGLLNRCRTSDGDAVLRSIAGEGGRVAVAGLDRALRAGVSAAPTAEGWRLDGDVKLVLDDGNAPWLLVVARTESGHWALLLVRRDADGMVARSYPTIDGRVASDFRFLRADAVLLSADAADALAAAEDEAATFLAVEAASLMRRLVQDTVAYAKQREQFGQTIGRFQVVQHRLVDMQIQARRARAISARAVSALDGPWRERGRLAAAAKATAAEAGRFVGQQAVQLHGGMGMTEELAIGRYFKRLTALETEFGSRDHHLRRFASLSA